MSDLICGIDPGLSGALGFIDVAGEFVAVYDMRALPTTTSRRQIDAAEVASVLREYRDGAH